MAGKNRIEFGLYIIKGGDFCKIGISYDINTKIRELQVGSPYELELKVFISCINEKDARKLEAKYHNQFSKKLVRGEWYKLDDKDIALVQSGEEPLLERHKSQCNGSVKCDFTPPKTASIISPPDDVLSLFPKSWRKQICEVVW